MATTTAPAAPASPLPNLGGGDGSQVVTNAGRVLAAPNQPVGAGAALTITVTKSKAADDLSVSVPSRSPEKEVSSGLTPQTRGGARQEGPSPKMSKTVDVTGASSLQNGPSTSSPLSTNAAPRFPPLETFDEIKRKRESHYVGPTTESNWVLPGKLLVGAYPGVEDDDENMTLLWSILSCGVTTFCCLQVEYPGPEVTEEMWRSGQAIRPYYNDAVNVIEHVDSMRKINPQSQHEKVTTSDRLGFVHVPIVDCSVTDDTTIVNLCRDLVRRLAEGEIVYLHCWGGHGRTGTAVCIMLHMMYKMSSSEALRYCQFVHDLRRIPINVGSPQTQMQREQVIRVIAQLEKERKEKEKEAREAMAKARSLHSSSNNNNSGKSPSPAKNAQALEIHNGRNGDESAAAAAADLGEGGGMRSHQPSSSSSSTSTGKKSIRQLREESREKRRESEAAKAGRKPEAAASGGRDNDMLISGLQLVKVEQSGASPGANTAQSTPDGTPPGPAGGSAVGLPPVTHTPSKNNGGGKVDEIMQASPVTVKPVQPVKPQPPASGAKRGAFSKRTVK